MHPSIIKNDLKDTEYFQPPIPFFFFLINMITFLSLSSLSFPKTRCSFPGLSSG